MNISFRLITMILRRALLVVGVALLAPGCSSSAKTVAAGAAPGAQGAPVATICTKPIAYDTAERVRFQDLKDLARHSTGVVIGKVQADVPSFTEPHEANTPEVVIKPVTIKVDQVLAGKAGDQVVYYERGGIVPCPASLPGASPLLKPGTTVLWFVAPGVDPALKNQQVQAFHGGLFRVEGQHVYALDNDPASKDVEAMTLGALTKELRSLIAS
jgi:hypothetical protein